MFFLYSEEVGIEMKSNLKVPTEHSSNFMLQYVWKSTSFDRMRKGIIFIPFKLLYIYKSNLNSFFFLSYTTTRKALQVFATNQNCVSSYIYHKLLGHQTGPETNYHDNDANDVKLSKYSADNLPELNRSQAFAVRHTLDRPLSLIQGPPGTGKTGKLLFFINI